MLVCTNANTLNTRGNYNLNNDSDISFVCHALCVSHKEFVETSCAVWLPFLLLEDAMVELPQTEGTHKVLGVKLAIECRDAAACDGLATATTQSALPRVEVL